MMVNAKPGTTTEQSVIISESWYDINHDGQKEKVEILLEKGDRRADAEEWCGNGEKWEGYFTIQVKKGDTVLSRQSLNDLMFPFEKEHEPLSFWTPEFSLVFNDYNMDGQVDFNIGQYGSCNGNYYKLFTAKPDGTIFPLPIKYAEGIFVSPSKKLNSTGLIRIEKGLLTFKYYDNTVGKYLTARYKWDKKEFVPTRKITK
jgi:bla regulator protein BlaR1